MSKPREEARAEEHLRNQGFEAFHPRLKHHRLKRGRQQTVIEPLFQRYLFIRLDDETNDWSSIRSTRGVAQLVRFSQYPAVVPEAVVSELQQLMDEDHVIDQTVEKPTLFQPGDRVEIISGSFKGWQAIIKEQDGDTRVTLMLNMLGRLQAVKMPISQLQSLEPSR